MTSTIQQFDYYEHPDATIAARHRSAARAAVTRNEIVWLPATETRLERFGYRSAHSATAEMEDMNLRIALCEMKRAGEIQILPTGSVRILPTTTQKQLRNGGTR